MGTKELKILLLKHVQNFICKLDKSTINYKEKEYDLKVIYKQIYDCLDNDYVTHLLIDLIAFDEYTFYHCINTAIYSLFFSLKAENYNEFELQDICESSLLHDIGKMKVGISILNKPGKLTDEEFEIMKMHPAYGTDILSEFNVKANIMLGVYQHHERLIGKSYPEGTNNVSLLGQLICFADNLDALTSDRPYRKTLKNTVVYDYIIKNTNILFNIDYVNVYKKYFIK